MFTIATHSKTQPAAIISHYFESLSPKQVKQFKQLGPIYEAWNTKINLISRKDIGQLYLRHVLHALSIAKLLTFKFGTTLLDVGTGGGFPGIPLAILFPQAQFHLIDAIGKKIKAVQDIAAALGLTNVTTSAVRAETVDEQYDFVLGRAVTDLTTFYDWVKKNLSCVSQNSLPNGILYLKGDTPSKLPFNTPLQIRTYPVCYFFEEPFFQTKQLVHLYP